MPVMENYAWFAGKQCALVISYGLPGWEGMAREEMLKLPWTLGMDFVGAVVLNATLPGDSVQGHNLRRLRDLAGILADPQTAEGLQPEDDVLLCPYCQSRLLTIKPDRSWRCVLCDGGGLVAAEEDGFRLTADPLAECRFSVGRRIAHERRLQETKQEFIERRAQIKARQQVYLSDDWWTRPS
jgi:hypothetical protein